jgi:hypothetical protein
MSKGLGTKIAIKFDKALTGDVSGLTPTPVGGYKVDFESNLSLNKPATAGLTRGTGYEADKAFDNNEATQWEPTYRGLTWLKVDLESAQDVMGVTLRSGSGGYALGYYIEASNDDTNWDLIYTATYPDYSLGSQAYVTIDFGEEKNYRYWMITVTHRSGNYPGFSIVNYHGKVGVGNEKAFTITGQEPSYTEIPSEVLGPLVDGDYEVASVESHPTEANTILLNMTGMGKFRNLEGNLTVTYDMTKGNLAGLGGAVLSFEEVFTPADLERMINPYLEEIVSAEIADLELSFISIVHIVLGDGPYPNAGMRNEEDYQDGIFYSGPENYETIAASITGLEIDLIHVDDLDP